MVRKTVTLVFCDVVDSTSLGERLDPESLRGVWSRYHDCARSVLERHGGTVEKFVGDAVMAAFGIPVLHEDDAVRAVRAAVELREAVATLNDELERDYGVRIGVRTGVNTGEVFAGDPAQGQAFATGDAVVVAQRLEATAGAGEILIGDATMRLVRDAVRAERVPPLELKGKAEPVSAWCLLEVFPDAAGRARHMDSPLVGRVHELGRLRAELDQAVSERSCRLVTILGEAGVGKSRLAAELVSSVKDEALVLEGRCLPYGQGITYWPLVEIVRGLDLAEVLGAVPGGDVAQRRILEVVGRAESSSRSDEIYAAVRRLLETLASERPVVVVLDDLQWAEPAFLDLVEYLAGWSRGAAILVCCLARTDLAELRPGWAGARVHLAPLARRESRALLENLLGPLDHEVADRVGRATGGNPLFLEEMLRMLVEDGVLVSREGRLEPLGAVDSFRVPETVQAVLAARLDRLDPEERAVLQRASVIGQVFWWGAVADLTPPEQVPEVAARLQALVRKGLIRPDAVTFAGEDGFRFGHILIRDAAYESMPKRLRAELHDRFADWAEQRPQAAELDEIIGHHLEQAVRLHLELGPAGAEEAALAARAAEHLLRAGRRALGRGDVHAAGNLLERTAALLPDDDPLRLELMPDLGLILTESGELARAEAMLSELLERPERTDELVQLAARIERAALRLRTAPQGGWERDLERVEAALPSIEAAAGQDVRTHRALARGWFLVGLVRGLWAGQVARGVEALERARLHARAAGDRRQEAEIVGRLGFAAWSGPEPVDDAIARCLALIAATPDDLLLEACCRRWIGCLVARQGRFAEARALVDAAAAAYEELGSRLDAASASAFGHADIEALAGDPAAAERALREGYETLGGLGELGHRATVAALLSRTLHAQGRAEEAERFALLVEETASQDDVWSQVICRLTRALLAADSGSPAEGVAIAREAVAIVKTTDLLDLHGDALLDLAAVLQLAGREDEARRHVEEALALYERKGNTVSADRARARLAVNATTA